MATPFDEKEKKAAVTGNQHIWTLTRCIFTRHAAAHTPDIHSGTPANIWDTNSAIHLIWTVKIRIRWNWIQNVNYLIKIAAASEIILEIWNPKLWTSRLLLRHDISSNTRYYVRICGLSCDMVISRHVYFYSNWIEVNSQETLFNTNVHFWNFFNSLAVSNTLKPRAVLVRVG